MGRIGIGEVIFIALVVILFFGTNRLPEIGNSIGKAIREFKKALNGTEEDASQSVDQKDHEKKS